MNDKKTPKKNADKSNFLSKIKYYYFKIPELLRFAFWTLVITLPIKFLLIMPTLVVGTSMVPSYGSGDAVLISKISEIERGDVVAIKPPKNNGFFDISFFKRVIGMPGDTVKIENKKLFLKLAGSDNFIEVEEPYVNNHKNMPDKITIVGSDEYFVMGDNRGVSYDSREIGPFKKKDLVGESIYRIWGFEKDQKKEDENNFKFLFDSHPAKYKFNF